MTIAIAMSLNCIRRAGRRCHFPYEEPVTWSGFNVITVTKKGISTERNKGIDRIALQIQISPRQRAAIIVMRLIEETQSVIPVNVTEKGIDLDDHNPSVRIQQTAERRIR